MRRLPLRKAPGPDHLRTEMLLPIKSVLAPLLSLLFCICYQWSYTPSLWRQAQVVPIHKKGDPTSPGNYRPISLTSIVRKLFEMCLFPFVEDCIGSSPLSSRSDALLPTPTQSLSCGRFPGHQVSL
ncbi:hypothetical protein G6F28_014258 [Rhizopus arrhizus]|nr:hypothetical protein G6F28_014258 [Rhizopus arrhizus]KAG1079184.1 hypothetical protein G6F39_014288 [Rhizopus arrhizus]